MGLFEAPLLIGGQFQSGAADAWFDSINPADEKIIGRAAIAAPDDIEAAVVAAEAAQAAWWALPDRDRAALINRLADAIEARADAIIAIEVRDTGNTVARLARDVAMSADALRHFAGLIPAMTGETARSHGNNLHFALREPYGVVARIVPFNHPFMFAAARIAAPLAAGNTVIVKTPEQSPLSSRLLAEACNEALPPGVVNIIHGPGHTSGDLLVRHPRIKRIGFTGSVPTGQAIQRAAAEASVKHVSLELGGKNPMVILPDMSPERAAEVAVAGMNFAWAGQSCGSTSRVMVHDSLYDQVVQKIAEKVDALRLGYPDDPESQMGPVNSRAQRDKVMRYVAAGQKEGARLVAGGTIPQGDIYECGWWVRPTVFADVTPDMQIARDEIFGPVMSVMRWRDEQEAIALANATDLGLTASIWTNDMAAALRLARGIETGYLWINGSSTHFLGLPFAGRRNSGVGSEEGIEELLSYTETKSISILAG